MDAHSMYVPFIVMMAVALYGSFAFGWVKYQYESGWFPITKDFRKFKWFMRGFMVFTLIFLIVLYALRLKGV